MVKVAARLALVAIGYFTCALLGHLLAVPHGFVTLWPPAGFMLGLLLVCKRGDWPAVVAGGMLGSFASHFYQGFDVPFAAVAATANGAETLLAAWFVSWRLREPISLTRLREIGELVIGAAMLTNALTALIGAAALRAEGMPFFTAWLVWWVGHGLGMIVIAPVLIAAVRAAQSRPTFTMPRVIEAVVVFAALIAIAELGLGQNEYGLQVRPFLTLPFLLWAGLRFGPAGGTAATFVVACLATWHAALGVGPFFDAATTVDAAIQVYSFLTVGSLCALIPAAVVKEREMAVRRQLVSENQYRAVVEAANDAIVTIDGTSRILFANPAVEAVFGYTPAELVGKPLTILMPKRLAPLHEHGMARFIATGKRNIEWRGAALTGLHRDGREIPIEISFGERVVEDQRIFTGIIRDMSEKRALEEQYRQSQKMEAVGKLAGGIAHDFNNLLTAIQGYAIMLKDGLEPGSTQHDDVGEILRASERAASLTSQLLAFSRQQVLAPRAVRLSDSLRSVEPMLRRLLGEHIDVVVRPVDVTDIMADPGQIEQVILNLAVNARDAMLDGGRLVLETHEFTADDAFSRAHAGVKPGDYVVLVVSDTGCGMDEATAARIFEPFFTTKEVGKGTGLGLSTVYGVVQQSGGAIEVDSEPNRGTTFTIYLPCTVKSSLPLN
jgi:PAS domain S-box-containing protein